LGAAKGKRESQPMLTFFEISDDTEVYEYCVRVTIVDEELSALGSLCRDRP
jgi:hypothetical protein